MDLAELKFVVDTTDLKTAATQIEKLGSAVEKLNKPLKEVTESSKSLNTEQQKTETVAKQAESAVKKQVSVLERQQMILEFMTQGFSKGQSSQLAYAKAAGAVTDELEQLGKVLQTQRTLMGTDPFDKSIGAMQALRNEYTVLKEVQRLYNAELGLSKGQMEDLAREKLRLIEKAKLEGASLTEVKQAIKELNAAYIQNATAENNLIASMKARQKVTQDTVKAQEYVAKEFDRINRLTASSGEITSATNNKLIKMEQALRLSGLSAAEQATKLDVYKKSLESVQKAAGNRQVDYLSRALGPQITDIFVGLATGQSPMIVLLQQGGQLRDQFALAGVAGAQMGDMLIQASKAMVTSIKDVAIAVGGLLVTAISSAGSALGSALIAPFKVFGSILYDVATGADTTAKAIEGLKIALMTLGKVSILLVITAIIAFTVALKDLILEQEKVIKTANLFGGSLGLTTGNIYAQAKAFDESGTNTGKYINAIMAAGKAGVQASSELKLVSDAIVAMAKVGVSADETAKRFADLGEKPTKALRDFAKEAGLVSPLMQERVRQLEEQGKKSEATALATKLMSTAMVDASKRIQSEQGIIVRSLDSISSAASKMWDSIMNIGRPTSIVEQLIEAQVELNERIRKAAETSAGPFNRQLVDADTEKLKLRVEDLRNQLIAEQDLSKAKIESSKAAADGEEQDKARKKAADDLKRAQQKTENDYKKLLENARQYYSGVVSAVDNLTKSEIALSKIRESDEYKALSDERKKEIDDYYEKASVNEKLKKQEEDRLKLTKEIAEASKRSREFIAGINGQVDKFGSEYYKNIERLNEAQLELGLSDEEYMRLLNSLYKLTTSYKSFIDFKINADKSISDSSAVRDSILSQYGTDFMPTNEKAKLEAEIKFAKEAAVAKAELDRDFAQSTKTMQGRELEDAKNLAREKYNAKVSAAQAGRDRELYILSEGFQRQKAYSDAFQNLFTGMADSIANFAKTGKLNFNDLVNSMIADLLRFELRLQTMQIYQGLRPSLMGMLGFGGSSGMTQSINPASGEFLGSLEFAKGGAFTNKIVDSPTTFKFAKGTGLMGEAGPEAIMPLSRDSSGRLGVQASGGSGSSVSVQIINNTDAQATTRETTDSKGNRKVEVVIGEMTASEIARSGSASQKSIRSTFGITPQLIRR